MVSIFIHFFLFLFIFFSKGNLFFRFFLFKDFVINFFDLWKFKEEGKSLISEKIDSEKISAKLEKEIFNKCS